MQDFTLVLGNKNYSSWSLRSWLAMEQFGIEFQDIVIPLYRPQSSQEIAAYSPSGKVPVLIHHSAKDESGRPLTIWDSLAICEYLAELHPERHFWGKKIEIKAKARSIAAEMHSGFLSLRQNLPMNCNLRHKKEIDREVGRDIQRITHIWGECRQQYRSVGNFLFGDFTIADAFYAPVVLRFRTYSVDLDEICRQYSEAILNLPAMQKWLEAASQETTIIPEYEP
jgi:glutathione S-transferase